MPKTLACVYGKLNATFVSHLTKLFILCFSLWCRFRYNTIMTVYMSTKAGRFPQFVDMNTFHWYVRPWYILFKCDCNISLWYNIGGAALAGNVNTKKYVHV